MGTTSGMVQPLYRNQHLTNTTKLTNKSTTVKINPEKKKFKKSSSYTPKVPNTN